MPEIRVISLPGETIRRRNVEAQMRELGLEFKFFDAVDAREGRDPVLDRFKPTSFLAHKGRVHRAGEVGCYASHFLLWQECAASEKPFLVLEDDFVFTKEAKRSLADVFALADTYDFIRLEPTRKKLSLEKMSSNNLKVIRFLKVPQALTGYQITPSAARRLYAASTVFRHPVDGFVRNQYLHRVPIHGVEPAVVVSGGGDLMPSTIGSRRGQPSAAWSKVSRSVFRLRGATLNFVENFRIFFAYKEYRSVKKLRLSRSLPSPDPVSNIIS
jgi:glycosyl transferase family 25